MFNADYKCHECGTICTRQYATPPDTEQFFKCQECNQRTGHKLQVVSPNPYEDLPDGATGDINYLTNDWTLTNNLHGVQYRIMIDPSDRHWGEELTRSIMVVSDIEDSYPIIARYLSDNSGQEVLPEHIPPMCDLEYEEKLAIVRFLGGEEYEFVDDEDEQTLLKAIIDRMSKMQRED